MAISEQQLSSWSSLGAQQGSAVTYKSIKLALERHNWPQGMDHHVYLQGSYTNHTNIRGDSDVDVVVETQSVFYHNGLRLAGRRERSNFLDCTLSANMA